MERLAPAFFDVCSHHPGADNQGFVMADKMAPVRRGVARILEAARDLDAPVLATTCLGVARSQKGMSAQVAAQGEAEDPALSLRESSCFIGQEASEEDLREALLHRRIVLDRRAGKTADDVVRARAFDPFGANPHTRSLVRALGPRHWYVFGAGFEHCLLSVVEGLRGLEMPVTVLEDGCVHGGRSVPASFLKAWQAVLATGAVWGSLDSVTLAGAAS